VRAQVKPPPPLRRENPPLAALPHECPPH